MIVNMTINSADDIVKVVFLNESKDDLSVMFGDKFVTDNYNIKANK